MRPLLISHRTHMGAYPENSRAGLLAALASGVDGIEIDVRATSDGRIVLIHDRSLARTTADPRNIDEVELGELRALALFGATTDEGIVTLEEALALCEGRTRLVVDVKQHGIAAGLEALLHAYRDRTEAWLWTHDPAIARECLDVTDPSIPKSLIVRPNEVDLWGSPEGLALARAEGLSGLLFEHPYVDTSLVSRANEAGLVLHCGRTNDDADVARILDAAPASMCSDIPESAAAVLAARTDAAAVHS